MKKKLSLLNLDQEIEIDDYSESIENIENCLKDIDILDNNILNNYKKILTKIIVRFGGTISHTINNQLTQIEVTSLDDEYMFIDNGIQLLDVNNEIDWEIS